MKWFYWSVLIAAVLLLPACGSDEPAPPDDPPVLVGGQQDMPKELATVVLTATPTPVIAGGQAVDVAQPSPTPGPPRPTATLTPYVGVFLGQPTLSPEDAANATPQPTLAPLVIGPAGVGSMGGSGVVDPVTGGGSCGVPVAPALQGAYARRPELSERLGCPVGGGLSLQMVTQPFERGSMYWRDTRQIYVLASSGQFWQIADQWQEGMPSEDPAYSAPAGLLQPVRGFGLVWRSNESIRNALGWATLPEAPYATTWQDFERGAMFVGGSGQVYAIFTAEGQHSGPL